MACLQCGGQTGPALWFYINERGLGCLFCHVGSDTSRQATAPNGQDYHVRRGVEVGQNLNRDRGLAFNHVRIVERGQKMRPGFCAIGLCGGQRVVEKVTDKANGDVLSTKGTGFVDLLPRCGDGHKNRAFNAHLTTHVGHALRMVSR